MQLGNVVAGAVLPVVTAGLGYGAYRAFASVENSGSNVEAVLKGTAGLAIGAGALLGGMASVIAIDAAGKGVGRPGVGVGVLVGAFGAALGAAYLADRAAGR